MASKAMDQLTFITKENDRLAMLIGLQQDTICKLASTITDYAASQTKASAATQEVDREMKKVKIDLLRDAWRSGQTILPQLVNGCVSKRASPGVAPATAVDARVRELIEQFFLACAKANIANLVGVSGAFTLDQFLTLCMVHSGVLPVDSLDGFLPGSKSPLAVAKEQSERMATFLPEDAMTAFGELIALRTAARRATTQPGTAETNVVGPAKVEDQRPKELIEQFFTACFADGSGDKLVGEHGVFLPAQFLRLCWIENGKLPIDAVDDFLPDSGTAVAVSELQMRVAHSRLPPDAVLALLELFSLRMAKRGAKTTSGADDKSNA